MSPCAYLLRFTTPVVIEELGPEGARIRVDARQQRTFRSVSGRHERTVYDDDLLCEEEIRRLAPADVEGWRAMGDVIRRLRDALRPPANGTSG